jgi:NAD(P)-dependent dehydrogenase (short-subunit alcohol dehydrogenase family)
MTIRGGAAALFDLTGRVAIVTGATRGIGRAIGMALGEAGATVIVSSEDPAACAATAAEFAAAGIAADPVACDIGSPDAIRALIAAAVSRYERIDVLVCNAGIEGPVGPLGAIGDAEIDRAIAVNLRSAMTLTAHAIPHMAERDGGSVILISSIAGLRGNRSIGVYGITKAALAQLARNLAVEWGPQGVRVNCISPGLIATDFARTILGNETYLARRLSLTPLRRAGKAHEIAAAALFLAGDGGAFVTGHNLVVDGGTLISDGN